MPWQTGETAIETWHYAFAPAGRGQRLDSIFDAAAGHRAGRADKVETGVPGRRVGEHLLMSAVVRLRNGVHTMRARDLAVEYPSVTLDTPALEAAQVLAASDLPGLIVIGEGGQVLVLPGTQVLRMAVPRYCQDDPTLARVIDEADVFARELDGRTVRECLPDQPPETPVVSGNATALEMAALMARTRSPLLAVTAADGSLAGVVTLHGLLDRILGDGA
jgi:CBS domain-containing protein